MVNESPVLSVRKLTTYLKLQSTVKVVDDISFDLQKGKTLALVGESGSGKTMTALSIMRILPKPPALHPQGTVLYQNQNILALSEKEMRKIRGKRIAMIFQDPSAALNPVYSIGEQLIEVVQYHLGLFGDDAIARCVESLKAVGIPDPFSQLNSYPHQLSGGMKQRIMIAMALLCDPEILIADEPTTSLDVTIQAQVLDIIRHLQKSRGLSVLLITHDMGIVAEIAHDVVVMYSGQAIERGPIHQIFDHMSHPYTIGLFNSRPDINAPKEELKPIKGSIPSILSQPSGCRFHPRCPFVMERCHQRAVPAFALDRSNRHQALCWLYDGSQESAEKLPKKSS